VSEEGLRVVKLFRQGRRVQARTVPEFDGT
jgi:hypothetical protein